jgi:hypothetical protein
MSPEETTSPEGNTSPRIADSPEATAPCEPSTAHVLTVSSEPGTAHVVTASSADPARGVDRAALQKAVANGASWFFWIAGLSVLNTILTLAGVEWSLVLGLGTTQIADGLAVAIGGAAFAVPIVVNLVVVGLFVLFGVYARKGRYWAFVVGMVLYGLDALIFVPFGDWLPVGFHAFALVMIALGVNALRKLRAAGRG